MKVVIVIGPMASGKTRNAEALAKSLGCTRVFDGDAPTLAALRKINEPSLILTNDPNVEGWKANYPGCTVRRHLGGDKTGPQL